MSIQATDIEALAIEDVNLAAEQEAISERRAEIKATLRDNLDVGTYPAGAYRVQIKAGAKRLDLAKIERDFPVSASPELYSAKPDTAKVKHNIAGAALESYYVEGTPSVVIS